jgi:transcription elongation GreA/GreB family factor
LDDDGPPRLPGGKFYMTPEGHERLQAELAARRAERHRVVEVVAWAAGNGDRSENADYKEGKVSIGSPVALALPGARVGDEVRIRTPRGPEVVEVVRLRYPEPQGRS